MPAQDHYGTGRRKNAVARVFLRPGSGKFVVNDKPVDVFFSRETGRMIVRQPLTLTDHLTTFDILVNVHGGGESGQAGAVRHGITRALIEYDASLKGALKQAEGLKAFFVNDPSRAWNEIKELQQIDLDMSGTIDSSELMALRAKSVRIGTADKLMEVFSTHPNMLKRIQHLSTLTIR